MLVEVKKDNGRSESGSAEGSSAVRESPEQVAPTAVRQTLARARPTDVRYSSGVEGTAVADVRKSSRRAIPTAVRSTSGPSGDGFVPDTRAERETILRHDDSRNYGKMGRGEAVIPVDVGPQRSQPDQSGRAGESVAFSRGEFGVGFRLPSSQPIAFKHAVRPTFSGQKPDLSPALETLGFTKKR